HVGCRLVHLRGERAAHRSLSLMGRSGRHMREVSVKPWTSTTGSPLPPRTYCSAAPFPNGCGPSTNPAGSPLLILISPYCLRLTTPSAAGIYRRLHLEVT